MVRCALQGRSADPASVRARAAALCPLTLLDSPFISIGTNLNQCTHAGNRATQVTFCGAPPVGKALFHGVLEANTMAAHLGLSRFYFKFREEFYGYAGGKPRAAKTTEISPA